jgi:threonine/homoserine/homoserine lactone efflux protein
VTHPLAFLLAAATLLLAPGPTNTLLALGAAQDGVRRALILLVAALAAYVLAIVVYRVVLGPVVAAYPMVGVALKIVVAAYLVWLAVRLWRAPAGTGGVREVTATALFTTTLLNPKALIFALTIFPAANAGILGYYAVFAALVLASGSAWALLGVGVSAASGTRAGWIPRVASVALIGFAGYIAVSAV